MEGDWSRPRERGGEWLRRARSVPSQKEGLPWGARGSGHPLLWRSAVGGQGEDAVSVPLLPRGTEESRTQAETESPGRLWEREGEQRPKDTGA